MVRAMSTELSTTVSNYLAALPADRRVAIEAVRDVINANLPAGYVEGILFGMPCWYIPLEDYPKTYNGSPLMLAGLASQKQHMAVYLQSVYANPELAAWFAKAYAATGKKLDMGKSCVRFKTLDGLALELIGEAIAKSPKNLFLANYEAAQVGMKVGEKAVPKPAQKPVAKKPKAKPTPSSRR